ncbi:helix-turn-helix domain-containing protein [Spirosoma koreense]
MNLFVDWVVLFQFFCIVQGITTGIWLLTSRTRQPAFFWLSWLVLGMTLQVIDYCLSRTGVYAQYNQLYFLPLFVSWGFGPFLYFAVQNWVRQSVQPSRWHLVPLLIQVVFFVFVSVHSLDYKTWFWKTVHKPYTRYVDYYGMCLSMFIYLGLSLNQLRQVQDSPRWLRWFLVSLGIFYALAVIDPLINHWYLPKRYPKFYLTEFVLPVFTYWLALIALVRSRRVTLAKEKAVAVVPDGHKERVIRALEQEQLYKDPDLTLDSLARQVGLPANTVSQTINSGMGKSLPDYLNELRVADVKRSLERGDAERFSILGIALEAGFRSKTTFNRVFKEQTGLSPRAYLQMCQTTRWDDPGR